MHYENNKSLILIGFHLNQKKTAEELTRLEILLSEINSKYEHSDVVIFADLNVDSSSKKFSKFKDKLLQSNIKILAT